MTARQGARSTESSSARAASLYRLLRRIRPVHRALMRVIEIHLADSGVTRPMRAVLEELNERGPQTVPQLARVLAVRRQFAQRVVNELGAAGLVERCATAAHRRSGIIAPTAAGCAQFEALSARECAAIERVAAHFAEDEVAVAIRVLEQLEDEARALGSQLEPPSATPNDD